MKRFVTLVMVLGLMAGLGFSQLHINPVVGVNSARLTDDPGDWKHNSRWGYQLGLNLRIGDAFYIQPGAHYMKWGHELQGPKDVIDDPREVIDNVDINGLHFPVLIGVKLGGGLDLRLNAGGAVTIVTSVGDNEFGIEKEDFNSTIFGAIAGVGIDIFIVSVDLTYELGLTKLYKDQDVKKNVFRLTAGLVF